ncbi:hypothetical protein [Rhodopseudomonas palustris]|uniref:hypothetical protein n=1 Tax=Rhodopseudomonas palustris TaxID=1076 RepID=UPI0002F72A7B
MARPPQLLEDTGVGSGSKLAFPATQARGGGLAKRLRCWRFQVGWSRVQAATLAFGNGEAKG